MQRCIGEKEKYEEEKKNREREEEEKTRTEKGENRQVKLKRSNGVAKGGIIGSSYLCSMGKMNG